METLLEEMTLIAGTQSPGAAVTPAAIDLAVANTADLWGLLQPYSHLNAGRVASGMSLFNKITFTAITIYNHVIYDHHLVW